MRSLVRWILLVVAVLVVVGLVAYARGPEHHRGDDVGALVTVTGTTSSTG
jgi:hypothetical protein